MTAKDLAAKLHGYLLTQGAYTFGNDAKGGGVVAAFSANEESAIGELSRELGFSGLAVQSVGYEVGVENPRVHIYLTRGLRRELQHAVDAIGGEAIPPVVLNRIGRVQIRPQAAEGTGLGRLFERKGRTACGSSCAPSAAKSAGTLGALVRSRSSNKLFALSNNHVLAGGNHVPVETPIMSPANIDGRAGVRAPVEIARHSEICELRSGHPEHVEPGCADLAIAEIVRATSVTSWQGDPNGYDTPHVVRAPESGMRVKKVGRTSGLTFGTVESFSSTAAPMPYKCDLFQARVWYKNVWIVRADPGEVFTLLGDSGSLVVTEDGQAAVGLVFATDPKGDRGLMIPMTHIVEQFGGLALVSKHGL